MSLPKSLQRKMLVPKPNETTDEGTILHLQKTFNQAVHLACPFLCICHSSYQKKKDFSIHSLEGHTPRRRKNFYLSSGKILLTIYKYTQCITQNRSVTSLHLVSIVI